MQKRVWETFAEALPTSACPFCRCRVESRRERLVLDVACAFQNVEDELRHLIPYLGRNHRQNFLQYLIGGPMADPSNEDRQQRLRKVRGKDS